MGIFYLMTTYVKRSLNEGKLVYIIELGKTVEVNDEFCSGIKVFAGLYSNVLTRF